MSTHGFGRPGTAPDAERESIHFTRVVNYGTGLDVGDVLEIAKRFVPKSKLDAFAAALRETR